MAVTLKAAGLQTFYNDLDAVPPGSLLKAENTIRDGIIEPRRGFKQYSTISNLSTDRAKQLFTYKNTILMHYASKMAYDNHSGTFTDFSGTFQELSLGLRIKSLEANGNFYFTTLDGIQKISAVTDADFTADPGFIRAAGGVPALDVTGVIDYSTPGFFDPMSKVAYRVVWGYTDLNSNLILGAPSGRLVLTNSSSQAAVVDLTFPIPTQIGPNDTQFFYQVYRTAVKDLGSLPSFDLIDPGDEEYLVLEDFPTPTELTSTRTITVQDITPETFRASGTLLYTNPNSGEGIDQANNPPPLAKDMALYASSVFYANTSTLFSMNLSLLSVSSLVSSTSKLVVANASVSNTYTFVGVKEIITLRFDTQANTNDAGYFLINAAGNARKYFVWFDKTGTTVQPSNPDTVGRLPIRIDISTLTTANDIATAVQTALIATDDFTSSIAIDTLTVTNANNGKTTAPVDGTNPVGGDFLATVTQIGDGEDISTQQILISAAPTPSQQIDETAQSIIRVINQNPNDVIYGYYLSGPNDLPGQMLFQARNIATGLFGMAVDSNNTAKEFNPALPIYESGTAAIGTGTVTITIPSHGLVNNQQIILYASTTTPIIDGIYTITNVTTNTFDINASVTVIGNVNVIDISTVFATNEVRANRLYYSKFQQPEAVPLVNFLDVGPRDKAILRILALRDSLFILKEDGVYRLTGVEAPQWTVTLFDNSTFTLAPDSAVVLNNQVYMLSSQGISRLTESGIGVISRPIEDKLKTIIIQNPNYKTATFGISYESDRSYMIFLPLASTDTEATYCLRFNSFTQAWTEWMKSNVSGIVNFGEDKLYLGAAANIVEQERKNLDRTDYADYQFQLSIGANAVNGTTVALSSNENVVAGDNIVQTQYVTLATFNRLLRKLDLDPTLTFKDYNSSLSMAPGDDLTDSMQNLVIKLNADPSTQSTYVFSGTTNFVQIQTEFNVIITTLNNDPGVFMANYQPSVGTQQIEGRVVTHVNNTNKIILDIITPFMVGPVTHYEGIPTDIMYVPQHFGDPSSYKQVNEATFIFEDDIFTSAMIAYNSDLSPSFEYIKFEGVGDGSWGNFVWGNQSWGGEGDQVPLRTYIPQAKQRSRFLRPRFLHTNAWEHYAIQGISLNPRAYSTRAYR